MINGRTTDERSLTMNFDYAIARAFHRKTAFEMADELQQLIKSQPSQAECGLCLVRQLGSPTLFMRVTTASTKPNEKGQNANPL